jgi:hypothetical protein
MVVDWCSVERNISRAFYRLRGIAQVLKTEFTFYCYPGRIRDQFYCHGLSGYVPIKLFLCHWLIDLGQFPSVTGHGFSEKHEVYSNGLAAHDNPCTKGSWETLGRIHAPKVSVEPQEVSRFFSSPPFLCSSSHEIITRTPVEGTLMEACRMIFVRLAVQIIILTDCPCHSGGYRFIFFC